MFAMICAAIKQMAGKGLYVTIGKQTLNTL